MAIGETSKIQTEDQGKIDSIVTKVKELNGRLADIRREQIFQRVSPSPRSREQPAAVGGKPKD